jgi:adsorption protein B
LLDSWLAALLAPLAIWVLLNALDDVVIDIACLVRFLRGRRTPMPVEKDLQAVPEKRTAIFVPLWKEYSVIQNMVEHNIAAQKYVNYDFFIGAYPNDAPTLAAVNELVRRFKTVHLAVCANPGPTSKADCLNWIYQRMLLHEEQTGARFETVLTHDAEDLVHPESLRWINYYAQWYDMVQIPVLALPTPALDLTHGAYCDEFAEFQTKDMMARVLLGGFIPSSGVGTGFSRKALEALALAHANCIFEPRCLTEDYENGFRINRLGLRQIFVPIHFHNGSFVATREYFPRQFSRAVRQRTRWVTGIALQSWAFHGWRDLVRHPYWFWRDRKGILSNLTTPVANAIFLYGAGTWAYAAALHHPWGLAAASHHAWLLPVCAVTLSIQGMHLGVRAWCSARIYGWRFASAVPLRILWANGMNCLATFHAIRQYATAKLQGRPLVWLKTDHAYPTREALVNHRPKLGEVLTGSAYVTPEDLAHALSTQPPGMRIGEWLVQQGKLSVEHLYEALSLVECVPLGKPSPEEISKPITRLLPADLARSLSVLPFRVVAHQLYVAGTNMPDDVVRKRIGDFCSLEIRFHLVTPSEFAELSQEYIPTSR